MGSRPRPILLIALLAGFVLRMDRLELVGLLFSPFLLSSIFVLNLVALLYRLVAIIDAYRVAEYLNAHAMSGGGRLGKARLPRNPLSIAGLLAVVLVMAGSHVVVARYDMLALDALTSGCIFIGEDQQECAGDPTASPEPSDAADPSAEATPSPTPEPTPIGSQVPDVSRAAVGRQGAPQHPAHRLRRAGRRPQHRHADHGVDRPGHEAGGDVQPAARHRSSCPLPAGTARSFWGRTYPNKINSFFVNNRKRSDLWPGNDRTRGYNGLKATLGELYDLDIKYFVEVNFNGFKKVVDAVGGVTINVQVPVVDDAFPGSTGRAQRLYIPSGIQHMDGDQALRYARSRNTSDDFDRGARQQRVLLSLREQADPQILLPRLPELVEALKSAVRTDIPLDQLDELLGLASEVDTTNIRSYVFTPDFYQNEVLSGYWLRAPSRPDPGGRPRRVHGGPCRPGAARAARRRGRRGLGAERHQLRRTAGPAWPATSSSMAWRHPLRARPPRARCRRTR